MCVVFTIRATTTVIACKMMRKLSTHIIKKCNNVLHKISFVRCVIAHLMLSNDATTLCTITVLFPVGWARKRHKKKDVRR